MPTTTTVTSSYAGEDAGKYISAALFSGVTLGAQGVTIMPNVKYQSALKTVAIADIIQNDSCDFLDTGTLDVGERLITPKRLKVNMQLCKNDFRDSWDAVKMGFSAHDQLPSSLTDYIISEQAAVVAQANETALWNGTDTAGSYLGLVPTIVAAGAADLTGAAPTASTIIADMQAAYDLIPKGVFGHEDLRFYVSEEDYRKYVQALAQVGTGQGYENKANMWLPSVGLAEESGLTFNGVRLFVTNGLNEGQFVIARKSNLYFGTGLMNDWNTVKTLDQEEIDGSDNVNFVMKFTAATQIGFRSDIVYRTNA